MSDLFWIQTIKHYDGIPEIFFFFKKVEFKSTSDFGFCSFYGGGSVVYDLLLIVSPIVGFCNCSMFCCALLCVHSSVAIILMGKRELDALLCLSSWCLLIVVWLFLTIPRVCVQFVIVVFPDHTHLLFLKKISRRQTSVKNYQEVKYIVANRFAMYVPKPMDHPCHVNKTALYHSI